MKTIKSIVAGCVTAIWLFAPSAVFAKNIDGDVVIIYDQAGSINSYDSQTIAKTCLLTIMDIFKAQRHITFASFDDTVTEQVNIDVSRANDMLALEKKVNSIMAQGDLSDIEAPVGYIQERNNVKPVAFAVIVSGGIPSIWNKKNYLLSERIKKDPRYFDLNKKYRSLKKRGLSDEELYTKLIDAYSSRNLKLINARLTNLKTGFNGKLVFIDVSGESDFLRQWAKSAGAFYLLSKSTEWTPPTANKSNNTMLELLKIASGVTGPQLAENNKKKFEPATPDQQIEVLTEPEPAVEIKIEKSVTENKPAIVVATPAAVALTPRETPAIAPQKPEEKQVGYTAILSALALFFITSIGFSAYLQMSIKKQKAPIARRPGRGKDIRISTDKKIPVRQDEAVGKSTIPRPHAKPEHDLTDTGEVRGRFQGMKRLRASGRKRLPSLKVTPPPNLMNVTWTNKNGMTMRTPLISMSLNQVMFETCEFDATQINSIELDNRSDILRLKKSRVRKDGKNTFVATLNEFEDSVNNHMKWIEIVTKIGEQTRTDKTQT